MKKKDKTSNKSSKDKIELRPKTTEFRSESSGEIIKSETQSESVLNAQQRMKRASVMRRIAPKLKMLRKNAKNRMATPERLKVRAENLARRFVKRRVAGSRGFDYANLGTGEKMSIDRLMIGKHPLVAAIARKLLPKVKQAETRRLTAAHHGKTITVNPMQLAKYKTNATKNLALGSGRNVSESLSKKSSLSNIPLNIIEEIFHRGIKDSKNQSRLTSEQYAFNRVNSFITGGKAFDMDQDLAEVLKMIRVKLPNGKIVLRKVDEKDVVTESARTANFRIAVTYSDPKHPSVSKRKEQIFKRMKVNTTDKDTAKKITQAHMKNKGYDVHGIDVVEDVNEMNYRYPPRPNIDRKAQDEIMRKAIEKISNISHTTPKAPTEWEEKHKANRKIGDEIMRRIQAKSAAEAQKRINAYRNAERSKRGLPPVSDD